MTPPRAAFALILTVLVLPGCGREPLAPMRVGTFPGPGTEPLFLAQQRGGLDPLDFRLVEFINDAEVVRALRNRTIEGAFLTIDELLLLTQSGLDPVVLFVAAESRGSDVVLAHPDVTSLADLKGRRVAVQVNSTSAFLLRRALKAAGLGVGDLQIVNLPPDRHRNAFLRREVDAVVTAEPVRSQIEALGGVDLFSSASMPLELMTVLVVRGDYLSQHTDRPAALCTAWYQAQQALRSPGEARNTVAANMRITPDALAQMLDVVRLVDRSESRALLGSPRPRLAATAARVQSSLVESGQLTSSVPVESLFGWPSEIDQTACRG